ncbi:S-adenosylmethionine:tRNA ribosyltransferase-isomerase [Sphaerochaeta pleomorpha str. Grapes]|uniref:S-adenosylmethionine:tRNA ribosyltransferase-isomerase n=1 Tax=Sphaerochaeta pleomorpha (strain ATCC BAA-1885 / DSM 22778 / Grapes) TaxID=158190 RepID=G8QW16_SPHPG|nr:tRNA preQ1(34) S-adenosylmethionine ribosyltransferase-isomerase QueA [Sphaerochaeta pleomorpha]AEV28259.1 S-adenosylmethionine:tRNA ribosyltransferase-isomerase [Sphaerochaeta pleomorpha str. Grapes]
MKIKEFSFDLPPELIAQTPAERRGNDRLLVLDRKNGTYTDAMMQDFVDYLEEGSVIVINNSKVRKARVFGMSETGGRVEFLFLEENLDHSWQVMVTKLKKQRVGKRYHFANEEGSLSYNAEIISENEDGTRTIAFAQPLDESFFQELGHVPLPPYIKREDDFKDETRYQTVFAKTEGSVAAPTAGLHFTQEIIDRILQKGCTFAPITLHVGPGTFLPVRTEDLEDHHMHYERFEVSEETARIVTEAKKAGKKIVATGTTSVRTLESAFNVEQQLLAPGLNRTNLFIMPGYQWKVVDQLLTNFHTPESTLLVLVSTFAGRDHIMGAYAHAVEERYRFYSYGDAMFIR